jgi:putative acetyltransferase
MQLMATELRPAECRDSGGLIRLIGAVFSEYPGCVMEVEHEEAGLLAPARSHERFWVLERDGAVVGCSACRVHDDETTGKVAEVKKVYLHPSMRGQGWGRRLIEKVESYAGERGIDVMICWSDTRFQGAHAAYEALGYVRIGKSRPLRDLSRSMEYGFRKQLSEETLRPDDPRR